MKQNVGSHTDVLIPDTHLTTEKTRHLINAYEKLHRIPEKDRIFREAEHPQRAVDVEKLRSVYSRALSLIERSSDDTQNTPGFSEEQMVMNFVRGCLIAKTLKEGDTVICVPMCPLDSKGNIRVDIKPVAWMEPERNLCGVGKDGEHFIPISYILARCDKRIESTAFGIPHSELLYLEHESEALPLFLAAQKQYDGISHSVDVMTIQLEKAGLLSKRTLEQKPSLLDTLKKNKKKAEQFNAGNSKVSERKNQKTR